MFVCEFSMCREVMVSMVVVDVVVAVDVYGNGYILFYCSNYIILLC